VGKLFNDLIDGKALGSSQWQSFRSPSFGTNLDSILLSIVSKIENASDLNFSYGL